MKFNTTIDGTRNVRRFLTSGFGLLILLGLGLRAGRQLLEMIVWGAQRAGIQLLELSVLGPLRATKRLLRRLQLLAREALWAGWRVLVLAVQGAQWTGRQLLELVVLGPLRLCRRLLGQLARWVGEALTAGKHLLEFLVRGTRRTGRWLLELFVLWPLRVCMLFLERVGLLVQGVARAGGRLLELLVQVVVRATRRMLKLLELLVLRPLRASKRLMGRLIQGARALLTASRTEVEATVVISSEGGPRVAHYIVTEATVLITTGQDEGRSFKVGDQPLTIGSGDTCDILLPGAESVAEEHLRIWRRDGRLMLHHLAPSEETIVAGKPVVWASLGDEEEAWIGPFLLRFSTASQQQDQDPRWKYQRVQR